MLNNLDSDKKDSSPMEFTSYETNEILNLEKMINHLGPERTFALGQELIKLAMDDYNQAMIDTENKIF